MMKRKKNQSTTKPVFICYFTVASLPVGINCTKLQSLKYGENRPEVQNLYDDPENLKTHKTATFLETLKRRNNLYLSSCFHL